MIYDADELILILKIVYSLAQTVGCQTLDLLFDNDRI